jgi:uncharacterized alkaline shock family protein YloU
MTEGTNTLGRIMISPRALSTIAAQAALSSYGIVGMASRNLVSGIAHALAKDPRVGVVVRTSCDPIEIDLYVVVEYGTRITSVASSVANTVRYQLEKALGMAVGPITVTVTDLHVSNTD